MKHVPLKSILALLSISTNFATSHAVAGFQDLEKGSETAIIYDGLVVAESKSALDYCQNFSKLVQTVNEKSPNHVLAVSCTIREMTFFSAPARHIKSVQEVISEGLIRPEYVISIESDLKKYLKEAIEIIGAALDRVHNGQKTMLEIPHYRVEATFTVGSVSK